MTPVHPSQARVVRVPASLVNLAHLAALLERIEQAGRAPDPAQYQQLVHHLDAEIRLRLADPALPEVLSCFPAAAQLYENQRYQVAGLCLSPLDRAIEAELATRQCLKACALRRPAAPPQGEAGRQA